MRKLHNALWVAAASLAVAAYLGFGLDREEAPSPPASSLARPDAVSATLANLDRTIAFHRGRVARDPASWLDLEQVARAFLGRAHLTGDLLDYAEADAALEEAFRRAPPGSGPFLTRAQLSYTLHRFDRVEADLAGATSGILVGDEVRRAADELRAAVSFQRGALREAESAVRRLLADRPTEGARIRLAQILWKEGDFSGAELTFREALAATPRVAKQRRAWLHLMLGLMDLDRGRYAEADARYAEADALFPGWYLIEEHRAEILVRTGRLDAARRAYEDIVARTGNPEMIDALAAVQAERGRSEEAERLRARARRSYEAQLARFPEAAYGHALDHYLDSDQLDRAVELAERNHALRPNGEAASKLARAYLRVGRLAEARRTIEGALATAWSTAELHATAAGVFEAVGDPALAAAERARARRIDPGR